MTDWTTPEGRAKLRAIAAANLPASDVAFRIGEMIALLDALERTEAERDEARRIAGAFAVRGIDATGMRGPTRADELTALSWAAERRTP